MNHTSLLRSVDSHLQNISTNLSTSIEVTIPDEIDVNVTNVAVPVSGTVAVTHDGLTDLAAAITSNKIDVNLKSNEVASFPVTGTVAVTHTGLTDLADAITSNKMDVNLKSNEISSFPVTGTVAVTNSALTDMGNQINSSGLVVTGAVTATQSGTYNVNLTQANTNTIPVSTGVKTNGTIRVCVADDDTNLKKLSDCVTGTNLNVGTHAVTVSSGSVSISGTPAVTVSSGSVNATCSGTVAVSSLSGTSAVNVSQIGGVAVSVNTGVVGTGTQRVTLASDDAQLTALNTTNTNAYNRNTRQSGGSLESLSVAEYKLIYKSSYAADATVFTKYYESFNSNCQFQDSDGGINIFPVAAPTAWIYGTRFHFLNGNNTWLVIFPGFVANSSSATPSLEVGVFYWDQNGYISITNDYAPGARPTLKYVLHDINQSAGIAMSSWNVDVFNGSGASGLNLDSDTNIKYAWSWFIMLGAPTNYAYIGLVALGKLWVGHQFSLQNPAAITSNTAKTNNIGFRPYYRNNTTTASKSVYCGGFEIYSKLGNYLNCSIVPYNFYNSYTLNSSTTVYPFAIFQQAASLSSSYINLKHVSCKTTGSLDVGDFRVEIWHTIDQSYTITGGTLVNNLGSAYFHGMTSITDANAVKIATLLPNADNCISRDISWIDHKHFGFHVQGLGGYTSIVYFLIINMSASVNKTAYFSIEWRE